MVIFLIFCLWECIFHVWFLLLFENCIEKCPIKEYNKTDCQVRNEYSEKMGRKCMKVVYIGIDLLYPALPALASMCQIDRIVTCETDNITEFNSKVCEFAKKNNILLQIGKISIDDICQWKEDGCDFAVCAGYYYKIPVVDDFLIVNIHPSLLPVGRGAWPMPVTILRKLDSSGITFHKMEKELDTGDIILQEKVSVSKDENLHTLTEKLQSLLPKMVERLVTEFDGLIQGASPQGEGEYWELIEETDMPICKETSVEEADLILRAFYGYGCIYQNEIKSFILLNGKICQEKTDFPVDGGYIKAEKAKENENTDTKDTVGNEK